MWVMQVCGRCRCVGDAGVWEKGRGRGFRLTRKLALSVNGEPVFPRRGNGPWGSNVALGHPPSVTLPQRKFWSWVWSVGHKIKQSNQLPSSSLAMMHFANLDLLTPAGADSTRLGGGRGEGLAGGGDTPAQSTSVSHCPWGLGTFGGFEGVFTPWKGQRLRSVECGSDRAPVQSCWQNPVTGRP